MDKNERIRREIISVIKDLTRAAGPDRPVLVGAEALAYALHAPYGDVREILYNLSRSGYCWWDKKEKKYKLGGYAIQDSYTRVVTPRRNYLIAYGYND